MERLPGSGWTLRFGERPWTTNLERSWHPHERARVVRRWREAFAWLARAHHVPHLDAVAVIATPHLRSRRGLQDTGGCNPAAKAAIDGLVDAGVLDGDGPDRVRRLTFEAPVLDGTDALDVAVYEVGPAGTAGPTVGRSGSDGVLGGG